MMQVERYNKRLRVIGQACQSSFHYIFILTFIFAAFHIIFVCVLVVSSFEAETLSLETEVLVISSYSVTYGTLHESNYCNSLS